ncbi:HPr kinase/phosphorylase [Litoreibacter roseus]|nr:serine kinase [Litoreibacter roseus]
MHGTAVALDGHAAILRGPSSSGKSSLALHLMALGCDLICDDQSEVLSDSGHLVVRRPISLPTLIEARHFGLIDVQQSSPARVSLVVDMVIAEDARSPEDRTCEILGQNVPLKQRADTLHFPYALFHYLKRQSILAMDMDR